MTLNDRENSYHTLAGQSAEKLSLFVMFIVILLFLFVVFIVILLFLFGMFIVILLLSHFVSWNRCGT